MADDLVEDLKRFGRAAAATAGGLGVAINEAFQATAARLQRHIRTTTGPFYRRWYWKAAYRTVDAFPNWVCVE